jgi:tRNA(Arg) A34 adenosine deaminase TadA
MITVMRQPDEYYMRLAIEAAQEAKSDGGVAIGAVLTKESTGQVIATGGSIVSINRDPTAHAEVNCIRAACARLTADDLYDYTLYSTLEPCHMCLSAAAWARIPRIFFGAYRKDVDETLFDIKGDFSDEEEAAHMNLREEIGMQVHGGVLELECASLLGKYHDLAKH